VHNKKLDLVHIEEFNKFEQLIIATLPIIDVQSDRFKLLYNAVKNKTIAEFCDNAMKTPALWKIGFFYYEENVPAMMAEKLYAEFPKDKKQILSNVLSSEEIEAKERVAMMV
jgi:hypothetical protein